MEKYNSLKMRIEMVQEALEEKLEDTWYIDDHSVYLQDTGALTAYWLMAHRAEESGVRLDAPTTEIMEEHLAHLEIALKITPERMVEPDNAKEITAYERYGPQSSPPEREAGRDQELER